MNGHQHHSVQTTKANVASDVAPSVTFGGKCPLKALADFQVDSEDGSSQTPSMTDGSSRTSSVYSGSEYPSAIGNRTNSAKSHASRSVSDTESVWCPQEDDNSYQRRRTQSPLPLRKSMVSR